MTDPLFHMISDGPRPVAPHSHAVELDGFVFVTGQVPEMLATIYNDIVARLTPTLDPSPQGGGRGEGVPCFLGGYWCDC